MTTIDIHVITWH